MSATLLFRRRPRIASNQAPLSVIAPIVSGPPHPGETLTCTPGIWSGASPITVTRQWLRDGEVISGETGLTYDVVEGDLGTFIGVVEHAENAYGSADAYSNTLEITEEEVDGTDPHWGSVRFLLGGGDDGVVDLSSAPHSVTNSGLTSDSENLLFGSPSFALSTSAFATVAGHATDWSLGTDDWVLEWWYRGAQPSYNSAWVGGPPWVLNWSWGGGVYRWVAGIANYYPTTVASPFSGSWNHMLMIRSGVHVAHFLNGYAMAKTTIGAEYSYADYVSSWNIGKRTTGGSAIGGNIAELRLTVGTNRGIDVVGIGSVTPGAPAGPIFAVPTTKFPRS